MALVACFSLSLSAMYLHVMQDAQFEVRVMPALTSDSDIPPSGLTESGGPAVQTPQARVPASSPLHERCWWLCADDPLVRSHLTAGQPPLPLFVIDSARDGQRRSH